MVKLTPTNRIDEIAFIRQLINERYGVCSGGYHEAKALIEYCVEEQEEASLKAINRSQFIEKIRSLREYYGQFLNSTELSEILQSFCN